jgi:hypothetical protein
LSVFLTRPSQAEYHPPQAEYHPSQAERHSSQAEYHPSKAVIVIMQRQTDRQFIHLVT